MSFDDQLKKIQTQKGFIAALDQSGGSTPKALGLYGVQPDAWSTDEEMFDLVHAMRTRIMTSTVFDGKRILGAILFENTMDREVEGKPTAAFLWQEKQVVPFLKVDKGLAAEENGVQLMKPILGLTELLERAVKNGIFGTKMRSVIKHADPAGIKAVVAQQFEVGSAILAAGLVPIIEPEIDISSPTKAEAEALLKADILEQLNQLPEDRQVMLKLTLPEEANFYRELVEHPRVLKVVALSGGYTRDESNRRLTENAGVIASFSRALTQGLTAQQSEEAFDALLNESIEGICQASCS